MFDRDMTYIKINRKILNWRWYKDEKVKSLFLHLLLTANICDLPFENIIVKRGELATSYPSLEKGTGLSIKSIRLALKKLIETGEVAASKYPKFSVISIVNYELYQNNGSDVGSQGAGEGQDNGSRRAGEGQQVKNDKNDKNTLSSQIPCDAQKKSSFNLYPPDSKYYKAAAWMADDIKQKQKSYSYPSEAVLQRWSDAFRKLEKIDKINWSHIRAVLVFARNDEFWKTVILSADKFRKKYNELRVKYENQTKNNQHSLTGSGRIPMFGEDEGLCDD